MSGQSYWNNRAVILNESLLKRGDDFYLSLASAYELAGNRIRKEIDAFYNRFATDNKVTYAQAKKLLTSDERRGFAMDVNDYIKKAKQTPYSPEWALALENASTVHRVTRLEYLNFQMRRQVEEVYGLFDKGMTRTVAETFEEGYYRSLYEAELAEGKSMPFAKLDTETVTQVINKPWTPDGTNFSDKIWKDRDKLVDYLHTELTQAFIRGESADRLIKDVKKRFGVSGKNAARLIQTETAFFSAMSKLESYKRLGYKKYIIVAALDEKTSQICRDMNGEVFDVDDFRPGVTANPFHPNCRSTTAPYMEKDDGQPGPGMVKDPKTGEMVKIPKDKSYREWLAERMAETDTAEGKKREDKTGEPVGEPVPTDVTSANLPPEPTDGIITLSGDDNNMKERGASGLRRSPFIELTDEDIAKLKVDIKAIEADESVFMFNDGYQTGYIDKLDRVIVMGDVFPDDKYSVHPRDLMSARAVLAHEYYGHRANRNTPLSRGAWNDEFRASYLAAKNAPGLTPQDKMFLILDARERAREAGVTIRFNGFMRRVVYGTDDSTVGADG